MYIYYKPSILIRIIYIFPPSISPHLGLILTISVSLFSPLTYNSFKMTPEAMPVKLGTIEVDKSPDGSIKIGANTSPEFFIASQIGRFELDGESIVCLPSQVGCRMACTICESTGPFDFPFEARKRFRANLRASDILTLATWAIHNIAPPPPDSTGIVWSFMGMGEPLDNYDQVTLAIRALAQVWPQSRATISTAGHDLSKIRRLANETFPIPVGLHISLHGSTDQQRREIIPAAQALKETLATAKYFYQKTGYPVKLNYVLVKGSNDDPDSAHRLGHLLSDQTSLILKISDLNLPDPRQVDKQQADKFADIVSGYGIPVERFTSRGQDINAGCGQFTISSISEIYSRS
ncbi:MAG: radical SAM protein [Dehalococcoidia bacterium]|nr:MAG: radical SAM protein [Dehalococcoidia bacterium]